MGNSASKAAERKFPQSSAATSAVKQAVKASATPRQPPPQKTPLSKATARPEEIQQDGQDPDFLERLKSLGTVKYQEIPKPAYKNDDDTIHTLKAREQMQREAQLDYEQRKTQPAATKSRVPPATITSILQSIKDGDSKERIIKDYNLSDDFLERLGSRFSIPVHHAQDDIATKEIRSLHQPKHAAKPKEGEVRPPKQFKGKSISI